MKKLITTAAFLMFGMMFITAQTTPKKEIRKAKSEVKRNSMETKLDTSTQPNGMKRTVDTANLDKRQKIEDNKIQKKVMPQKDGLNNEAVKPSQPAPEQME